MRFPKPFFRKSKSAWYLQVGKRQVSLGPDRAEAFTLYREVYVPQLGGTIERRQDFKTIVLCDLFLDLHKDKMKSWDWYRHFLDAFTDQCGHMRVIDLKPFHLNGWLAKTKWNDTTKNKVIGIVKRVFNWAAKEHYIKENPFATVVKPRPKRRERVVTREERVTILNAIRDEAFKDFVVAMTETGARPGEIRVLTAANVDIKRGLWTLLRHKNEGKTGKPRVIYLSPKAQKLTLKLLKANPAGCLFRNKYGKPWTKNAIRCRFKRLREKTPALAGVVAYCYRHSFITDALVRQVPIATVAELVGHASTQTIEKHYGHLDQQANYLKEAAKKATIGVV